MDWGMSLDAEIYVQHYLTIKLLGSLSILY